MRKAINLTVMGVITLFLIILGMLMGQYGISSIDSPADYVSRASEWKLPEVKAAVTKQAVSQTRIYSKDYSFTKDWVTYNIPVWEKIMQQHKGKPDLRYLEIGVFEGRSMLWMLDNVLTNPTSGATGIDVDPEELYYENLAKSGQENRVETIIGYSQVELRKLPLDSFDIIYIDGSHTARDVLEDAILSLRILKKGGILIFDDHLWNFHIKPPQDIPKTAINIFYMLYNKDFEVIHNGYQAVFLKK